MIKMGEERNPTSSNILLKDFFLNPKHGVKGVVFYGHTNQKELEKVVTPNTAQ